MATDPNSDFQAFIDFALQQSRTGAPMTPEDALEIWRAEHPLDESDEDDEIVAMVQEALDDIAAGDQGMPAEQFLAELRVRYGLK